MKKAIRIVTYLITITLTCPLWGYGQNPFWEEVKKYKSANA